MVTIDFSQRKNSSLTEFIYSQLKEQIISQILKPNEKLPSKRALANHLGVSVITTQNAYELLIAEGYIFSSERSDLIASEVFYIIGYLLYTIGINMIQVSYRAFILDTFDNQYQTQVLKLFF